MQSKAIGSLFVSVHIPYGFMTIGKNSEPSLTALYHLSNYVRTTSTTYGFVLEFSFEKGNGLALNLNITMAYSKVVAHVLGSFSRIL